MRCGGRFARRNCRRRGGWRSCGRHEWGFRSTSTILFGHIERPEHVARHLGVLWDLTARTPGITEFIPLPFVPYRTRLGREHGISEMVGKERRSCCTRWARLFFGRFDTQLAGLVGEVGPGGGEREFPVRVNDLGRRCWRRALRGRRVEVRGVAWAGGDGGGISEAGRMPVRRDTLYHAVDGAGFSHQGGFAGSEASVADATAWPPFCCVAAFVAASLEKLRR